MFQWMGDPRLHHLLKFIIKRSACFAFTCMGIINSHTDVSMIALTECLFKKFFKDTCAQLGTLRSAGRIWQWKEWYARKSQIVWTIEMWQIKWFWLLHTFDGTHNTYTCHVQQPCQHSICYASRYTITIMPQAICKPISIPVASNSLQETTTIRM